MLILRKLLDVLFFGLATYLGVGESQAGRRGAPALLVVPRYPPPGLLFPEVAKSDLTVAVVLDGELVGYLTARHPIWIDGDKPGKGVLCFRSISGEDLAAVDLPLPSGDCRRGCVVRYFPELVDGEPRHACVAEWR